MRGDGLLHPPLVRIGGIGVDSTSTNFQGEAGYGYLKVSFLHSTLVYHY